MLELVVTACLMATPDKCKDVAIAQAPAGMTVNACMSQAQMPLAEWAGQNPAYRIKSWTCRIRGKGGVDA